MSSVKGPVQLEARAIHLRALDVPAGVGAAGAAPEGVARLGEVEVCRVEVLGIEVALLGMADRRDPGKPREVGKKSVFVDVELHLDFERPGVLARVARDRAAHLSRLRQSSAAVPMSSVASMNQNAASVGPSPLPVCSRSPFRR